MQAGSREFAEQLGFLKACFVVGVICGLLSPLALVVFNPGTSIALVLLMLMATSFAAATTAATQGSLQQARSMILVFVGAASCVSVAFADASPIVYLPATIAPALLSLRWMSRPLLTLGAGVSFAGLIFSVIAAASMGASEGIMSSALLCAVGIAGLFFLGRELRSRQDQLASFAREARQQAQLLSAATPGLVTRHDASGATRFASQSARHFVGAEPSTLLNSGFIEKVHLQDRVKFLKALSDCNEDGRDRACEIRIRAKGHDNQVWRLFDVQLRLIKDKGPLNGQIMAAHLDVSERRSQQDALAAAKASARENGVSQKKFLATMSHELRTPLSAILGFSDILKQELFGKLETEKQREYVKLIHDSGRHLLNVVNDMLDMSRIESGKYELNVEQFALREVCDATIRMLQPLAMDAGVQVSVDCASNLPEIFADRRACHQILINVVSNAIKFTPEGGTVKVVARQHGSRIRIKVIDTGVGIPTEFLSQIGQPFMQANSGLDREHEGSGLGLSVVQGLVDLHGGSLEFSSIEGRGTTVGITLPLRAVASRPVPADNEKSLVHLNPTDGHKPSAPNVTHSNELQAEDKGDSRARVSA
ncbi:MAG: PAS domain-containing sensor histidine kinase [Pseudomonadota bacterium]